MVEILPVAGVSHDFRSEKRRLETKTLTAIWKLALDWLSGKVPSSLLKICCSSLRS